MREVRRYVLERLTFLRQSFYFSVLSSVEIWTANKKAYNIRSIDKDYVSVVSLSTTLNQALRLLLNQRPVRNLSMVVGFPTDFAQFPFTILVGLCEISLVLRKTHVI